MSVVSNLSSDIERFHVHTPYPFHFNIFKIGNQESVKCKKNALSIIKNILGVENDAGPSRDSAILEVERREKPQIEVYPSDNQTVVQG